MEIIYLPTTEMIADILTKPLQGELFKKMRRLLLNLNTSFGVNTKEPKPSTNTKPSKKIHPQQPSPTRTTYAKATATPSS